MQLSDIKGIGQKRLGRLGASGITTTEQLLFYPPYKILDFSVPPNLNELKDEEEFCFIGKVSAKPELKFVKRGLNYVKVEFAPYYVTHTTDLPHISATFFNQRFIIRQLDIDKIFFVSGKFKRFKDKVQVKSPQILPCAENSELCFPIYKLPKGLPASVLREAVRQILSSTKIESRIPEALAKKYNLLPLSKAVQATHFPASKSEAERAAESLMREKLANDILLYMFLKSRQNFTRIKSYDEKRLGEIDRLISTLGFDLTDGQKAALGRIFDGLSVSDKTLNILLEGDVGSGKTIVAFLAAYYAALNGYQTCIMTPTEILALQHYKNALNLFKDTAVKIAYLSSSQNAKMRADSLFNIKYGVADIVIGTHSVIQRGVIFKNLSLCITDEQHRFGVLQRGELENKSNSVDRIVMSATPIPRTLALSFYGDLETVEIRDKPPKKADTLTRFVSFEKQKDMYLYLLKKCADGEQCFIVCPRIGEADNEDDERLASVESVYKKLFPAFKAVCIGMLHGKLSGDEKNYVLNAFSKGDIKALVTTTVIEVGIDFPNATSIVVLNAERYGLSQLHQLRGRVGRGEKDGYCFILSDNASAKERLNYFYKSDNGFELAEYDFTTRGAGDFLGTRQHGESDAKITPDIIRVAKSIALEMLERPDTVLPDEEQIEKYSVIKNITMN